MFGSFWVHSQFFDVARVSEPDLTSAENEGPHSNRTALGLATVNADLSAHVALRVCVADFRELAVNSTNASANFGAVDLIEK